MKVYNNIFNKHKLTIFLLTVSLFINALISFDYNLELQNHKALKSEWVVLTSVKSVKHILIFRKGTNKTRAQHINHHYDISALLEFNRLVNIQYTCSFNKSHGIIVKLRKSLLHQPIAPSDDYLYSNSV